MTATQEKVNYLLTQLKQEVDRTKKLADETIVIDMHDQCDKEAHKASSEAYDESFNLVVLAFPEEAKQWRTMQ